jgi:hypothetical protein
MGGSVLLGYEVRDNKVPINEEKAERVPTVFRGIPFRIAADQLSV